MLFFFPDVHLRELEKLWTDKIIVEALWREFMEKLVSEWTEFVLYVCLRLPLSAQTTPILTLINPTVNSDACFKCGVSSYPRCHCRPFELPFELRSSKHMDQTLSCSNYKFHVLGV